ncbi:hypothetical protein SADUNF_Sadunf05G0117000 [Salix dunnii]|uniref:C2H2-type domain-containing protein n=1 Tax=Salix dunnii TaxID=1413687 RepID=A0A835KAS4_9ROSI|nr:hypothetical protein SADUNF_Sadunf05G0117000 [Salix dunnii]
MLLYSRIESLEVNHLISTRIAESSSKKRKRGRPRKNENVNFGNNELVEREQIENITIAVVCDDVEVQNKKKEEMEMVSMNGVVVDFVALGNMEDPYGDELRRRTEGMQLKAEFVGFLGFEFEWGSTRKKRRIVDASLFGDALPIGWKLSICVKKQAGRVWLACTRYTSHLLILEDVCFHSILDRFPNPILSSPNGLQFVSCKEVSSYLLSFSGLNDVRQLNFDHMDGRIKLTGKTTSSISADQTCTDGKNEIDFICHKALPVTSTSIETGCPRDFQTGMNYECHKCTLTFTEQDDLLQHMLSSHRWSPKLLRKRHRINGHLGNHIKDYLKKLDASGGITNEPASFQIPFGALMIQTSNDINSDSDEITSNTKTNSEIISTIPYCEMKAYTTVEAYCGKQDKENTLNYDIIEDRNCSSTIDNMVIDGWDADGKDNKTGLLNSNAVETMKEKGFEGDLTGIENSMNSVCTGMLIESKFNDVGKPGTNELTSVCRGNKTALVDDNDADIETCTVHESCFLFAGNQHTLTAKDNATVQSVEKNLDTAFTGSIQEETSVNNSENSKKEDLVHDFSGHPGPNESVRSEFMWRNDEENDLLRADTSCQPVQASGFFPLYDAVSDKGESELSGSTYGEVLKG